MQRKLITNILLALVVSTKLLAAGNAPIQRVDMVNLLGSGGGTPSTISVVFGTDSSAIPCLTKKLAYQEAMTVWAGVGQVCTTPVTSITVTPLPANGTLIYDVPLVPTYISNTLYSTQITVSQNTAPLFDPNNGALIATGTLMITASSHWTQNHSE